VPWVISSECFSSSAIPCVCLSVLNPWLNVTRWRAVQSGQARAWWRAVSTVGTTTSVAPMRGGSSSRGGTRARHGTSAPSGKATS